MSTTAVIPCFNSGRPLLEAVESVRRGNENTEIIVVNDGSTDASTLETLRQVEAQGIRVIHGENQGVSHARNVGIEAAEGEIIIPLDADDRLCPGSVALAASILDVQQDVAIVAGAQLRFGSENRVQKCAYTGISSMLISTTIPNSSFFRKQDWKKVDGYPEELSIGEDWAFWMRILRLGGEVVVLDDVLHEYRVSPSQATHAVDPLKVVAAQNLVLRENARVYPLHMIVEIATHNRLEAAHLRRKYGRLDTAAHKIQDVVKRLKP